MDTPLTTRYSAHPLRFPPDLPAGLGQCTDCGARMDITTWAASSCPGPAPFTIPIASVTEPLDALQETPRP